MKKIALELSEEELRKVAEMAAMTLALLGMDKNKADEAAISEWQRLAVRLLNIAHNTPALAQDMEMSPELRHWQFKQDYVDQAFFTALLDEARDTIFWEELMIRMAEQTLNRTLPPAEQESLSDEERRSRVSSLENAIWKELTQHGIERLIFMLPERDS